MSAYDEEYDGGTTATADAEEKQDLLEQVMANTPPMQSMSAEALQATIKAEVDIQISTAKAYPRNLKRFFNDARTLATLDEKTAGDCFYKLPRGGKKIEGPSVRLAEIVASSWGNLRTVTRIISIDRETLTAQAMCHDLETNVASTMEVRRRITDRNGRRYNDDMITVTANAAASIAYRNSVFKVVPFAHVKPIFDEAKLTSLGKNKTFAQQREDALKYWRSKKITDEQLCATLEIPSINDMTIDDLISLRGFFTAIKDGECKIEDVFPPPGSAKAGESLEQRLKDRAKSVNGQPEKKDEPKTETAKPSEEAQTLYNDLLGSIKECGDKKTLGDMITNAGADISKLRKASESLYEQLQKDILAHRQTLSK